MAKTLPVRYSPHGALGDLEVDGKDLSNLVSRVTIDHVGGQLPKVFLELKQGHPVDEILVDGMVHVKETVYEDPAEAALRFLEPIDPGELERACLAAMELGGPTNFGEAALQILRAWTSSGD